MQFCPVVSEICRGHVHVARKERRRIIIIKQIIIIIRYKIQTWEKKSRLLSSVMVTGSVDCDGKNLWNDIQPQFVHTANQLIFVSELFSQWHCKNYLSQMQPYLMSLTQINLFIAKTCRSEFVNTVKPV